MEETISEENASTKRKTKKQLKAEVEAEAKAKAKVKDIEPEPEAPVKWMLPGEMRVDLIENLNQLNQVLAQEGDLTHKIIGLKKQRTTIDETIEKLKKDTEILSGQIGQLYLTRNQMIDKACYKQNVLPAMYDFNLQDGIATKKPEFR